MEVENNTADNSTEVKSKNAQQLLESLDKRLHKIERKMKIDSILGMIKWFIIVVPIIFGVIYLSPIVKQYSVYLEPALKLLHLNTSQNDSQLLTDEQKAVICDPKLRAVLVNQICK